MARVICPVFPNSMKPMLLNACSVEDNRPARTSITVTLASALCTVSKIFIWSETDATSTTSVTSG
jgi:hypothetical protein